MSSSKTSPPRNLRWSDALWAQIVSILEAATATWRAQSPHPDPSALLAEIEALPEHLAAVAKMFMGDVFGCQKKSAYEIIWRLCAHQGYILPEFASLNNGDTTRCRILPPANAVFVMTAWFERHNYPIMSPAMVSFIDYDKEFRAIRVDGEQGNWAGGPHRSNYFVPATLKEIQSLVTSWRERSSPVWEQAPALKEALLSASASASPSVPSDPLVTASRNAITTLRSLGARVTQDAVADRVASTFPLSACSRQTIARAFKKAGSSFAKEIAG